MGFTDKYHKICCFILGALFVPFLAHAQSAKETANFRALLTQQMVNRDPIAINYKLDNGVGFIIDRTNRNEILLKFDNSDEVWKLNSVFGSRGDEFLLNDIGETIVRITSLGGVTYYRQKDNKGSPASSRGKTRPIARLENVRTITLQNPQTIIDNTISRFHDANYSINRVDIDQSLPQALVKDTINRVFDAYSNCGQSNLPRGTIKTLAIKRTVQNYVTIRGNRLEIGVTPGIDYSGRPSSRAIQKAILGN